jgi:hypothetical protein
VILRSHFIPLGLNRTDLGTIDVGKLADMHIVDGDPLTSMTNLASVIVVIQGGVVYNPNQLLPMLPATEPLSVEDNLR